MAFSGIAIAAYYARGASMHSQGLGILPEGGNGSLERSSTVSGKIAAHRAAFPSP